MKEIEEILARDRAAGVPQPPDVRYTVAAVRRRAGAPRSVGTHEWLIGAAAAGMLLGSAGLAILLGVHPLWLGLIPFVTLLLAPILLRKGA